MSQFSLFFFHYNLFSIDFHFHTNANHCLFVAEESAHKNNVNILQNNRKQLKIYKHLSPHRSRPYAIFCCLYAYYRSTNISILLSKKLDGTSNRQDLRVSERTERVSDRILRLSRLYHRKKEEKHVYYILYFRTSQ